MTRKLTVTYELPEELCEVLEEMAAEQGRPLEELVAEHLISFRHAQKDRNGSDADARKAAFERFLGAWEGTDPGASDNERIDADLAREHNAT